MSAVAKITVATAWLDGCSGCHMSLLDMDERLIELARQVDIVYSPLVDTKTLPGAGRRRHTRGLGQHARMTSKRPAVPPALRASDQPR